MENNTENLSDNPAVKIIILEPDCNDNSLLKDSYTRFLTEEIND